MTSDVSAQTNYSNSARYLDRSRKCLAGGVSSEFRKYNYPHALFYDHAQGVHIYDVDGNQYLDFTLSQGPLIVGHSHPQVVESVRSYSEQGQLFAGQHLLEVELAEKLQKYIPSAELMRFCLDGSTAIQAALRIARAKTGKSKFIRFEGHYHGWLDNVCWGLTLDQERMGPTEHPVSLPWSQGLASQVSDEFILLPWNNLDLVEQTLMDHHHEVAAIITEPIMCNSSCILPKTGYLEGLRKLCNKYRVTLIFDEVITGFRCGLGGAQQLFSVVPDLSVFGKAMASGYPISAIVGKKPWMELVADGQVIHAGTMNSACPLIAAAMATIQLLEEPGTYDRIYQLGQKLMDGLRTAADRTGHNLLIQGLGPMFHTGFNHVEKVSDFRDSQTYDKEKLAEFIARLHDKGIRVIGRGLWYISAVHSEEHIDHALEVSEEVLREMK